MNRLLTGLVALISGCCLSSAADAQAENGGKPPIVESLSLIGTTQASSVGPSQLDDDLATLFNAMDQLSPHDIWGKPLVKLELLGPADSQGKRYRDSEYGILIEQSPQFVHIWSSRLRTRKVSTTLLKEGDWELGSVEVTTLQAQVLHFKEQLNGSDRNFLFSELTAVFWARVAHACGETRMRDELVAIAKSLLKDRPLSYLNEGIIPYEEYLRIVRSFEDAEVRRERILEDLIRLVQLFPHFSNVAEAIKLRDNVKSLVEEDARHESVLDVDILPVKERIAELIYQLRNLTEGPLTSIKYPAMVTHANVHGKEPCRKLLRLGLAAAPQLIEAVSDSRPSRIVDYPRIFANTAEVVTIGQCAELILRQYLEEKPGFEMTSISDRQAAYRKWYEEVESNGVREYLTGVVEKGGEASARLALILANSYPEDALKSIPIGVSRSMDRGTRFEMYAVMSTLGEPGHNYLKAQLSKETDPSLRSYIIDLTAPSLTEANK